MYVLIVHIFTKVSSPLPHGAGVGAWSGGVAREILKHKIENVVEVYSPLPLIFLGRDIATGIGWLGAPRPPPMVE